LKKVKKEKKEKMFPYNFSGIAVNMKKLVPSRNRMIKRHLSSFYLGENINQ
jgi:hypothetical protein